MKALVEAVLFFLPLTPFLNVCRNPGFLRRLSLFPRVFIALGVCGVLYLTLGVLLVWHLPHLAAWLIALASPPALYVFYWRARPTFGSHRRLPPGSLRLAPSGPWVDYLYYQKQASKYGPVCKMSNFVQPMICITGIQTGMDFLKHHEESTATPPMPFNRHIPSGFMRYMAPAVHMDYRNRMKVIFSDHAFLQRREESVTGIIREALLAMTDGSAVIHPVPHFQHMAFSILVELFLGLSHQNPKFGRLEKLYKQIDYRRALFCLPWRTEGFLDEIEDIFREQALAGESYFSNFLGNGEPSRTKQLHDQTVLRNFIYLLQTSWIDVSDLLAWIFKLLGDHPHWINSLRAHLRSLDEVHRQAAHQLANRIALETLRLEQSEYLMRRALHDIHFNGFLIPQGWLVRIGIRESHRDPGIFADPDTFNPDRFATTPYGSKQYSPFGIGQKSCVGKGLALWIGQRFALELARGFEWRVVHDGPRALGVFHWQPSPTLRIQMCRRADD